MTDSARIVWFGAEVPAHFGDPQAEYAALRRGVGFVDLAWYGVVELVGPDRVQFLNGMVSNDVRDLGGTGGCHATMLTVHGKMIASLVVAAFDDRFLLLVEANRARTVIEHLDHFLIADDAQLADRSGEFGIVAVSGPKAAAVLAKNGWPAPEKLWQHAPAGGDLHVIRWQLTGEPSWAILCRRERRAEVGKSLVGAGAHPVGLDALNVARVEAGIPWYGVDATEESFPLETRFDKAISTTKGCYLGQETIIRILHRGHVNRRLLGLVIEGEALPPSGAEVFSDDKAIGVVTSAVRSPTLGKPIALAVLRLKSAAPGAKVKLTAPGGSVGATVVELPFV